MISRENSSRPSEVALSTNPNIVDAMQINTPATNRQNLSTLEDFIHIISQTISSASQAVQYPYGIDRGIPNDARIQYAMYYVEQGLQRFPDSYDLKVRFFVIDIDPLGLSLRITYILSRQSIVDNFQA